ncbi:MAG TPA: PIN domain-containing protein [Pirellulales bacterium]|nr:PIN domain-containing protein [Pirellulales bacterium]
MVEVVLLDAGPLGLVSHPRPSMEAAAWLAQLVVAGIEVLVPEIADYEVRRELLRANRTRGIERLNEMKDELGYLPITTEAMLRAAELWAEARRHGRPTAGNESLDADVILAAQAEMIRGREVLVASTNPKHIKRFVPAEDWRDIQP